MKNNIYKFGIIIMILTSMGAGCEKEYISQTLLDGKWILVGFGDDSTNEFTTEPESEPKSSYIIFNNGEMDAFSVTNRTFNMKYIIKSGNEVSTTPGVMTLVGGDTEWGHKFLISINDIFKFKKNSIELFLFYKDHKFMKLKKEII